MAVDVEHPNPPLAPCPFCGSPQPIPHQLGPTGDGGAWYIACDALDCGQTSEAYGTLDVAIARWNCRVPIYVPSPIVGALKDCPCCGLKAAFQTIDGRFTWVVCPGCKLMTSPMGTSAAAAEAWNRRQPPASTPIDAVEQARASAPRRLGELLAHAQRGTIIETCDRGCWEQWSHERDNTYQHFIWDKSVKAWSRLDFQLYPFQLTFPARYVPDDGDRHNDPNTRGPLLPVEPPTEPSAPCAYDQATQAQPVAPPRQDAEMPGSKQKALFEEIPWPEARPAEKLSPLERTLALEFPAAPVLEAPEDPEGQMPIWAKKVCSKPLWQEDDTTRGYDPDHEDVRQRWRMLFGATMPERTAALAEWDGGDALASVFEVNGRGIIYWNCCDADELRELHPTTWAEVQRQLVTAEKP